MLFAVAGLAWLLHESYPRLARAFLVLALVVLPPLAGIWLMIPGALTLMCIPTILALAMLGPTPDVPEAYCDRHASARWC